MLTSPNGGGFYDLTKRFRRLHNLPWHRSTDQWDLNVLFAPRKKSWFIWPANAGRGKRSFLNHRGKFTGADDGDGDGTRRTRIRVSIVVVNYCSRDQWSSYPNKIMGRPPVSSLPLQRASIKIKMTTMSDPESECHENCVGIFLYNMVYLVRCSLIYYYPLIRSILEIV